MILPKTRKAGTTGRPRLKGARQPTLQMRLIDPHTVWQTMPVAWYGGVKREVEVATGTALWYHTGMAPVAIRWVLLRDPEGKFDPQALLCTDQNVESAQIIAWFVLRWQVAVTFHEVRAHLGVETRAAVVGSGYFANHSRPFSSLFDRFHLCPSIAG